jgi:hypothetical protein
VTRGYTSGILSALRPKVTLSKFLIPGPEEVLICTDAIGICRGLLCVEEAKRRLAYPLTAPPVVPLAMYFWIKKPTIIIGTIVRVAAALLFPQSTEIEPTNFEIPTGSV